MAKRLSVCNPEIIVKEKNRLFTLPIIITINIMDTSSRHASEGCVSNDFFRHSLDNSRTSYLLYSICPAHPQMSLKC